MKDGNTDQKSRPDEKYENALFLESIKDEVDKSFVHSEFEKNIYDFQMRSVQMICHETSTDFAIFYKL